MKTVKVMVTSAGGIVAQGIIKSLKYHNGSEGKKQHKYKILGTDISYDAAGLYRCDKFAIVKKPDQKDYIRNLIDICSQEKIHVIFVGSDIELPILCKTKDLLEDRTGAKVITSQENIVEMCRDKYLTNEFLIKNNLNSIPTCLPAEADLFLEKNHFPLVVKPREGFGSKLLSIVHNKDELEFAVKTIEKIGWRPMIQKYLQNDALEFTTGITLNYYTKKIMSIITLKKILKHGQTYKAFIDRYPKVEKICREVVGKLGAVGPLNIQTRIDPDDNKIKIMEINPRFSASCPMRTTAGINEPDIMIRNILFKEKIKIKKYRLLVCMRYWEETYVDLADYNKIRSNRTKIKSLKSEKLNYF
ncbi:MAG: ATP-grasp domain-containing protein [Candidatus Nitrosocosmicus sp.]|jgi:carbamoyl-phosphate synthase large subunit|nr:ATP-grasp domain-containing protein [Candidatus Nitrosocosmicus sp.]